MKLKKKKAKEIGDHVRKKKLIAFNQTEERRKKGDTAFFLFIHSTHFFLEGLLCAEPGDAAVMKRSPHPPIPALLLEEINGT